MDVLLAALVTAAALSMAVAAGLMIYDTTLEHPGIGKRMVRVVTVLWLWPIVVCGIPAIGYTLGIMWRQALA